MTLCDIIYPTTLEKNQNPNQNPGLCRTWMKHQRGKMSQNILASRVHRVINEFGTSPLAGTPVEDNNRGTLEATPSTVLAMLIDAMLKSHPISHNLSQKAVKTVLGAGYHDIERLRESSWEERTMVLKDGGYNRYREQGATNLADLAKVVCEEYGMFFSISNSEVACCSCCSRFIAAGL